MVMIRSEVGQMIQNEDENQAFHRRVGEILRIAVNVEEDLDFFIANYFCTPQSYKTFLLKDLWLVEQTGFGRKINIFKKICKEEKIDEKWVNGIVEAMNFVIEKRNVFNKVWEILKERFVLNFEFSWALPTSSKN